MDRFISFDAYLERPYVDQATEEAGFEWFCDREGLDRGSDEAWYEFEEYLVIGHLYPDPDRQRDEDPYEREVW